tara:strand:- start:24028 stop:24366 length:339 start_codon:yes stop_codon:yes gene_type:complete
MPSTPQAPALDCTFSHAKFSARMRPKLAEVSHSRGCWRFAAHSLGIPAPGRSEGKGDIKGLQGPLEGFNRLRIGGLRIIYRQISGKAILLEYANTPDPVYELYEQILENRKP